MNLALAALAISAFTSSSSSTLVNENEIRSIYKQIEVCVAKSDCESAIAMLDKNYVYTDINGKTFNRAEMASQMRAMSKSFRNAKTKIKINELYVNGNEATAWVTMTVWAEMNMGNKWTKMSHTQKFIETLSKSSGHWLFTHSFENK